MWVLYRGEEVEVVDVSICGREPDVGIMAEYVDEFSLKREDGTLVDLEDMTDQESDEISNKIMESYCGSQERGGYNETD